MQSYCIIAFQVYEILNMAVLTGKRLTWPVEVYAVRSSGFADEITKLSQCWSSDIHVIKVKLRPFEFDFKKSNVFFDGRIVPIYNLISVVTVVHFIAGCRLSTRIDFMWYE